MPQPNLPVVERIAQKILARLNSHAQQAAGCHNDFVARRMKLTGNVPKADQVAPGKVFAIIGQPPAVPLEHDNYFQNWLQPFWIYLYVNPDESNTEDFDTRINLAKADCERVLCNSEVIQWDGLAHNTTIGDSQPFEYGRAYGMRVEINVQFSHVFYNPNQSAIDT